MTVVLAIAHDGEVVMAADTLTNYSGDPVYGAIKVRRVGDLLLGAAGNGALAAGAERVLGHEPDLTVSPLLDAAPEVWSTWADLLAQALTEGLGERNLVRQPSESTPELDGVLLVAVSGRLVYVFTGQAILAAPLAPGEPVVAAIGSGEQAARGYAAGALAQDPTLDHDDLARDAVAHACRTAQGCGWSEAAPIQVHRL